MKNVLKFLQTGTYTVIYPSVEDSFSPSVSLSSIDESSKSNSAVETSENSKVKGLLDRIEKNMNPGESTKNAVLPVLAPITAPASSILHRDGGGSIEKRACSHDHSHDHSHSHEHQQDRENASRRPTMLDDDYDYEFAKSQLNTFGNHQFQYDSDSSLGEYAYHEEESVDDTDSLLHRNSR
jgi:hypothetical protein